jgi:hypothetical protein
VWVWGRRREGEGKGKRVRVGRVSLKERKGQRSEQVKMSF